MDQWNGVNVVGAGLALSSSAFVLPELERRGWKNAPEGVAALSILLLQDLAVAPLLVLLLGLLRELPELGQIRLG